MFLFAPIGLFSEPPIHLQIIKLFISQIRLQLLLIRFSFRKIYELFESGPLFKHLAGSINYETLPEMLFGQSNSDCLILFADVTQICILFLLNFKVRLPVTFVFDRSVFPFICYSVANLEQKRNKEPEKTWERAEHMFLFSFWLVSKLFWEKLNYNLQNLTRIFASSLNGRSLIKVEGLFCSNWMV